MEQTYDLFVSYASHNTEIAEYVVRRLEERGLKCFIAPRDICLGKDYASEIVRGIGHSEAVLLIFSSESDRSVYVLREINSAVSRNKTIIPLRIENFLPCAAMEFYLGPTQWMDAFPEVLDTHLDQIIAIVESVKKSSSKSEENKKIVVREACVLDVVDAIQKLGIPYKQFTMRAIELDFMTVSPNRETGETEKQSVYEEWKEISDYPDAGGVLVENDSMIGYCDFYPVAQESYDRLMSGAELVRPDMIELYSLGGEFYGYIAMMAIDPAFVTQEKYLLLFDWVMNSLLRWKKKGISICKIGVEAYIVLLEKFLRRFGFRQVGVNPEGGRLYEISMSELLNNSVVRKRYHFCEEIANPYSA